MLLKDNLRKKFNSIRKKKYFEVSNQFYNPLLNLLKGISKKKVIKVSLYYPSNFEVNTLKLLKILKKKKNILTFLPNIYSKNEIKFYEWSYLDLLKVNKYGLLEPLILKKPSIPTIILVPMLAYDTNKQRLGYGKGYYDRFLNKYLKLNKNITTIGVAFSFQKYNKLPASNFDVKMNYILTENGIY